MIADMTDSQPEF